MNLKFEGNQVTSFFKLNQQYFFTVHQQAFATGLCVKSLFLRWLYTYELFMERTEFQNKLISEIYPIRKHFTETFEEKMKA